MDSIKENAHELLEGLTPASQGAGPLLQRDYWAVLQGCSLTPREVASLVRERFVEFPPESLVIFRRDHDNGELLKVGDELDIQIRMSGKAGVRVTCINENSLTLATLRGHPEAGRITFGSYRNNRGDVIFHIRSIARSSSSHRYLGFFVGGEPMQTNTWTDFIDRLAHTVGDGVVGAIHVETQKVSDSEKTEAVDTPTFIAQGE